MKFPNPIPALKGFFGLSRGAATALQPLPEPKVANRPQAQASFSKRTKTSNGDQRLTSKDRQTANLDLLTLRNGTNTKSIIRDLSKVGPDLSASVWAYQRMVVSRDFMAVARNQDGTANPQATDALQQILARMNYLTDYAHGFTNVTGIIGVAEMLTLELRLEGACSMELVLDKARLPARLQPIAVSQLEFYEDSKGEVYPIQKAADGERVLDTPAFFYESMDQDLLTAYADSPMEASLQAVLADVEFTNDVRRVIKRALHPRLDAAIDWDDFRKSVPPEVMGDHDKMSAYQDEYIGAIEETVNGLEPDDALVHFDSVEFSYLNNGNASLEREWNTLQSMVNSKLATGTKAPPAVLGHGSGSQNIASSESMLFIRYCEGVQNKVNSILSRALTLAVRLLGHDVYVQFEFARPDLRADSELESFKSMKQSRILDLLSIGILTDDEASLQLTGKLPPAGASKLSGTMFRSGAGTLQSPDNGNPYSNTSQSTFGKSTAPDTPQAPKGSTKNDPTKVNSK